jgi:hypothetical protein
LALQHFADQSDRAVAEMCGVGYSLVSDVRKSQLPESGSSKHTGKDGKARRMPAKAAKTDICVHSEQLAETPKTLTFQGNVPDGGGPPRVNTASMGHGKGFFSARRVTILS